MPSLYRRRQGAPAASGTVRADNEARNPCGKTNSPQGWFA